VRAPTGNGVLPVEVDGAVRRGVGEEGSDQAGRDWAVAVGQPGETIRFLIYSN
jgi:hypothetical protein